jgi:Chromo (CHRromatin Organisation MOdifier) domain
MSKKQKQALGRGGFESNGDEGDSEESAHTRTDYSEEDNAIGYQSIDDAGEGHTRTDYSEEDNAIGYQSIDDAGEGHTRTDYSEEDNAIGYQSIDDAGEGVGSNDDAAKSSVQSVEYGTVRIQGVEEHFEFEELDPSEVLVLGPGEFLVQSILERRPGKGKKQEYLVKWVGHDNPEDNTWEPGSGLPEDLVTEYNQKFPFRRPLRR